MFHQVFARNETFIIQLIVKSQVKKGGKEMKKEKVYVKTVYQSSHHKEPNISEYKTKKEAESFIETCLQWGIGIVSCKIVKDKSK